MEVELLANIIIISVLGFTCFLVIAVKCYMKYRRQQSEIDISQLNEMYIVDLQVNEDQIQWKACDEKFMPQDDHCCICLDDRVQTSTSCKHHFHFNCLIQWKKRAKPFCPYCKSNSLEKVTFYCHHCKLQKFQYQFRAPMTEYRIHMVPQFFLDFLSNSKRLLCNNCKEKGLQEVCQSSRKTKRTGKDLKNKSSFKSSRRRPVNIQLISIATSSARASQAPKLSEKLSEQNIDLGPTTNQRILIQA